VEVTLRGAADRREQLARLGEREAHARVAHLEAPTGERSQPDLRGRTGVELVARRDRVHTVLQQLAQVDARARVQVPGEQVDDAPEVDLERLGAGVRHRLG